MSIVTPIAPLHVRMFALARTGHDHAEALTEAATELEIALTKMDREFSPITLRDCLRLQHRAKMAWWRATGEQG